MALHRHLDLGVACLDTIMIHIDTNDYSLAPQGQRTHSCPAKQFLSERELGLSFVLVQMSK